MVWWTLLAGFVLGVLLLGLAAVPALRRRRALELAVRRLRARQEEAVVLQARLTGLQGRVAEIQARAQRAAADVAALRARPGRPAIPQRPAR